VPSVQSIASVQVSKELRRVKEHWSEGMRDLGIGEKRWSSNALYFNMLTDDLAIGYSGNDIGSWKG
jgi:hypothetical protein